jgi:hypothetical protein
MQAPYVNVTNGGLYVYNSGVNTATITAAGTLTCKTYGSYCMALISPTGCAWSANQTQDMLWSLPSSGTSDITHTIDTAGFGFNTSGKYLLTVSYMISSGVTFSSTLNALLIKSTSSSFTSPTNVSVQTMPVTNVLSASVVHTFPVISVTGGEYYKVSLNNSSTQVLSLTQLCGTTGGSSTGTIPCSFVQFVRIS